MGETAHAGIELHLIELLAHGDPQTTQVLPRQLSSSPETDDKTPLLKTISTQLTEHEQVKLVPTQSFHS